MLHELRELHSNTFQTTITVGFPSKSCRLTTATGATTDLQPLLIADRFANPLQSYHLMCSAHLHKSQWIFLGQAACHCRSRATPQTIFATIGKTYFLSIFLQMPRSKRHSFQSPVYFAISPACFNQCICIRFFSSFVRKAQPWTLHRELLK